jgi:thiamine pyrophosphokinase
MSKKRMTRESSPELVFTGRAGRKTAQTRIAVVVLEGAQPSELNRSWALAMRFTAHPVLIAVDGGVSTCLALRKRPDLFVGDLDSAPRVPAGVVARVYPVDKDFSDCSGALVEARAAAAQIVVIAGLLGGRLDHEWANVQEIGAAAKGFAGIIAPTARGVIVATAGGVRVRGASGQGFSVFAFGAGARVSLRGARWTLSRRRLPPGSLGLSNLAKGALALDVHDGVVALVLPGL